jgi:hypothetical protein
MRTFLRGLDRALIHLYCLAGLLIAFTFLAAEVEYNRAASTMLKKQAEALYIIASELYGIKS